jgi:hypothetical protein
MKLTNELGKWMVEREREREEKKKCEGEGEGFLYTPKTPR